jgi:tetratricopeptide (TPR) repeat protein
VTLLAYLALIGWIPVSLVLYVLLPARRATVATIIGAWTLLPPYGISIPGLPDLSKSLAATIGVFLGTLIFAPDRLTTFRPRWFDLSMLAWCCSGLLASLHNGLGLYDGLTQVVEQLLAYGLPYLIGRMYFNDSDGLRELAIGIVLGGLMYVPPLLYEIKMSPQFLGTLYGKSKWVGLHEGFFYRPTVFFWSSLDCGLWMTAASLAALWLWRCGLLKAIGPIPFGGVLLPVLLVTTILCKSTGALILLTAGLSLLWMCPRFNTRLPLWALMVVFPVYAGVRIPRLWSGQQVVKLVEVYISPERAVSLKYRLRAEGVYTAHAMKEPVFGWGGWDRGAVYGFFDDEDNFYPVEERGLKPSDYYKVPPDGLWVLVFSTKGFVGLSLLSVAMGLPVVWFLLRFPARVWRQPQVAPAAFAAVLLGLYTIDCLVNAFVNLIYVVLAGSLIGIRLTRDRRESLEDGGADAVNGRNRTRLREAAITGAARPVRALDRCGASTSRPPRVVAAAAGRIRLADRYRTLGRTFKEQGRLAEAQSAWRHALDLLTEPAALHPEVCDSRRRWCDCANDLAWLQLNHPDLAGRDPDSTVRLASQVVDRCPECGLYWNTLGAAYCRAGDFESAITALDRAMDLSGGGTAFDDVFLAMAYAQLGQAERARHHLDRATHWMEQHHPDHPELLRAYGEAQALLPPVCSRFGSTDTSVPNGYDR